MGTRRRRSAGARILRALAVLVVAVVLAVAGLALWGWNAASSTNVGRVTFDRPLAIPPLAPSTVDAQGVRRFDLTMAPGRAELLPGTRTDTWGIDGAYLGPTLRAARGERVAIDLHNRLPEATSMHWHGIELPARADGGPHSPIAPGTTWSPSWTIDQPASTLWYHPHPHGRTAEHVHRGLAGMFWVDDAGSAALPLPHRYGVDDIPVILQDRVFDADGAMPAQANSSAGMLGDEILVNGTHGPVLDVWTSTVRLRVVNASAARVYDLALDDGRGYSVVGTDSGLLDAPVPATHWQVAPGDRAEIVVPVRPGETALLRSLPPDLDTNAIGSRLGGGDDTFDLMALRAAPVLEPSPPLPTRLATTPAIEPTPGVPPREFRLDGNSQINGREMDMNRIDAVVPTGRVEVWNVRTDAAIPHSFHVHDAAFRVLDVGGAPPPPELRGRQDTIHLPQGEWVRLAVAFGQHPDPDVPFMIHCHMLDHEDRGMMAQFVLVRPDQHDRVGAGGHPGMHG
ncbi:FtsP/CotA-like multicopper oxidase with cupredoxin domain [Pseudonocardia sediminis]|uniref:FtsP/CotA-like multicopper oxidase with cupredoxin domain n=1 Tax=Pseudonocardia sediminis TaxID=1397368 RepID=A0A4V2FR95_PSEST|nr:multicopper oxidase domain-containing protein [Pseudonocardia sediminis]RZT87750.1 FtsP/CotA-like multicopper oxidase with cupredoxin domain [Pseudonocardia sediminis]